MHEGCLEVTSNENSRDSGEWPHMPGYWAEKLCEIFSLCDLFFSIYRQYLDPEVPVGWKKTKHRNVYKVRWTITRKFGTFPLGWKEPNIAEVMCSGSPINHSQVGAAHSGQTLRTYDSWHQQPSTLWKRADTKHKQEIKSLESASGMPASTGGGSASNTGRFSEHAPPSCLQRRGRFFSLCHVWGLADTPVCCFRVTTRWKEPRHFSLQAKLIS